MKIYRGVVKGNTVILEDKPDLPDEYQALVEIKPLDRDEETVVQAVELVKQHHISFWDALIAACMHGEWDPCDCH